MLPPEVIGSIEAATSIQEKVRRLKKTLTIASKKIEKARVKIQELSLDSQKLITDSKRKPGDLLSKRMTVDSSYIGLDKAKEIISYVLHDAETVSHKLSTWSEEEEKKSRKSTRIYRQLYGVNEPF